MQVTLFLQKKNEVRAKLGSARSNDKIARRNVERHFTVLHSPYGAGVAYVYQ